jgi:DNA-binding beta-propeller fold protein YncE
LDALPPADGASTPNRAAHLYVASSDFDLQYRASALAAYDLDQLSALLPQSCNVDSDCTGANRTRCDNHSSDPSFLCRDDGPSPSPCGELGEHSPADLLLYPGRCQSVDLTRHPEVIADTVQIGAFATDVIFRQVPQPPDPKATPGDPRAGRLFLPVRGDATLHWVDIQTTGRLLDCGQANTTDDSCDGRHRIGDDADTESENRLRQEPEPFAIAIDDAGNNIAITNQTTGSVSLYANDWAKDATPILMSILTGLPTAPVGIAAVPSPALPGDTSYEPGFLVVYKNAPEVDLLRVHDTTADLAPNSGSYNPRVLTRAGAVAISANSIGSDSRGIAIDDSERKKDYELCDQKCAVGDDDCLTSCRRVVHQPNVYVSNRAPASLLVGALTADFGYASGTSELPSFTDSVPLTVGASRVVLGKVRVPGTTYTDAAGVGYDLEQRVFVVCFDSRRVYIYDPGRRALDSIVKTGRGPFALAIDEARGVGYVAHFTDSYLGVISLDQRFPKNYASIIGSVGVPSPPRASK